MNLVFVMDSLDRVNPDLDTTYGFVQAAVERGHACFQCLIHHLEASGRTLRARVRPLRFEGRNLCAGDEELRDLAEVDAVVIRKDPPFDSAYHYATLMLELLRGKTLVINDPEGLRRANEKIYALEFPQFIPPTMVSSNVASILDFAEEVGGEAVIKPLDGAGGYGVLALRRSDDNAKAIADVLTREGRQLAIVQKFLPEVREGDKRVLMLNGELMGAILRVPQQGDLRANIHVGGSVVPTELSAEEKILVEEVGQRLRRDGLVFVGLDLIGGRLTEVNVTSPTGIRELSRFRGTRESDRVIAWIEAAVSSQADGKN
jgi:glutathione synthase